MSAPHRVVVVGNGLAGARLQEEIHRRDADAARVQVVVYGDENHAAYNRILLSNVVAGHLTPRDTRIKPENWCERNGLETHIGVAVTSIDRERRTITRSDGYTDTYDTLVLATGSRSFLPPAPGMTDADGHPADGVVAFRTLADCDAITAGSGPGSRVVVIGAGLLGIEAARGALMRGSDVTIVHPRAYPMERQMDAGGGAVLTRVLRELGMDVALGARAEALRTAPDGTRELVLSDGSALPADLVVVAAGIRPNIDLAVAAGLDVDRAVVVDDDLRTSDPHIRAIGECAQHRGEVYGLVQPAWEMAGVVADQLCGTASRAEYHGTAQITRLKAHDVDLASMGEIDVDPNDTESEVLVMSDPTRGRYAKVVVRKDRLVGAVMLGNPEVVGTLSQYFDGGSLVPVDRMTLLLGHLVGGPTESSNPSTMPDAAVICRCNTVTKKHLVSAWRDGAHTPEAMAEKTRATTGCGSCVGVVDGLCDWLHRADPVPDSGRPPAFPVTDGRPPAFPVTDGRPPAFPVTA
ncbi:MULTISPECIES: FAD-dependent oxidoreductase [Nocardiaceae]|uniref:Assimilatory nitrate reductase electron transfer subunit n=1 Tax=Rhodococcoides corynebacterioides TaxID=53972 RepID=A0ABS2KSS7_9NOCA|nr:MULTISPECIES: FAD-dependent oxidoreductase [Rhodococcus]MBM7414331.1 assimilatory nitrate reductase electron transfer subunit [Rhodococcus corynebacterioides]MBP1116794.1 assimilatory nitrate reductase electron transfer subunit [Rhodococcus sp. PvP016]